MALKEKSRLAITLILQSPFAAPDLVVYDQTKPEPSTSSTSLKLMFGEESRSSHLRAQRGEHIEVARRIADLDALEQLVIRLGVTRGAAFSPDWSRMGRNPDSRKIRAVLTRATLFLVQWDAGNLRKRDAVDEHRIESGCLQSRHGGRYNELLQ